MIPAGDQVPAGTGLVTMWKLNQLWQFLLHSHLLPSSHLPLILGWLHHTSHKLTGGHPGVELPSCFFISCFRLMLIQFPSWPLGGTNRFPWLSSSFLIVPLTFIQDPYLPGGVYSLSEPEQRAMDNFISDSLATGIIHHFSSPFLSFSSLKRTIPCGIVLSMREWTK